MSSALRATRRARPCSGIPQRVEPSIFSSRRRHTRLQGDWSSDVCSSDLEDAAEFLIAGATAVQVGTATFWDPRAPVRIAAELSTFLRRENVARAADLVGTLKM